MSQYEDDGDRLILYEDELRDSGQLDKEDRMSQIWKPQSNETHRYWIDTIMTEALEDLTDWETNFIDNVGTIIYNKGTLSQRQEEILERIYAGKTK